MNDLDNLFASAETVLCQVARQDAIQACRAAFLGAYWAGRYLKTRGIDIAVVGMGPGAREAATVGACLGGAAQR